MVDEYDEMGIYLSIALNTMRLFFHAPLLMANLMEHHSKIDAPRLLSVEAWRLNILREQKLGRPVYVAHFHEY